MSLPFLLDALASRLLGPSNGSTFQENAHLRLRKCFVENVIHGTRRNLSLRINSDHEIDPILMLEGIALSWNLSQRFDHATALKLLIERFQSCELIPNGIYHLARKYNSTTRRLEDDIALTEQKNLLHFLYQLYYLKSPLHDLNSTTPDLQLHRLSAYAEQLLNQQDDGTNGARKDIGWFFASGKASSRGKPAETELSINDTTFDTMWTALLSKSNSNTTKNEPQLKHPIFSSPDLQSNWNSHSPPESLNRPHLLPFNAGNPTHVHRAEGLGSLFGMLRFAHPAVVPKVFGSGSDVSDGMIPMPKLRLDISGDEMGPLELPKLQIPTELPDWLKLQDLKPASILDTLSPSLSDRKNPLVPEKTGRITEVVSRKVTVADWLERTWHGAAGPLPPWKTAHSGEGLLIEDEPLEWKDRLVYRARLLNMASETISEALISYQEHIKSLFEDSLFTASAFNNAVRRFINFWRGELLFAQQKEPKRVEKPSKAPNVLDDILPSIGTLSLHDTEPEEHEDIQNNAVHRSEKDDFDKSFHRIVSTTGSCTQIVHLYHLVGQVLEISGSGTQYPTGVQPINKLVDICIQTEMDPPITHGITRQLLTLTLVPFARFFAEWLFWGALPAHSEFMISSRLARQSGEQHHTASSLPTSFKSDSRTSTTYSHWIEAYSVKDSHVPVFLKQHEELVLKTGLLVQVYRDLQLDEVSQSSSKQPNRRRNNESDVAPVLRPIWSLSQLSKYYAEIRRYIQGNEDAVNEHWADLEWLEENGDGCVSVSQSLYDSFVVPLQIQFDWVSPAVCRRLVNDWSVMSVLERLKSDFFGNLVNFAFEALPLGVDLLDESASSNSLDRLRLIFCENIQGNLQKLGYRLALEKIPKSSGFDILDNIVIEPTFITWPLTILISPQHLEQYNSVFVLLTKMTRTRAALNSIWTNLSAATRLAHRQQAMFQKAMTSLSPGDSIFEIDWKSTFQSLHKASLFCHQLQHFWAQLYTFIADQVAQNCFYQLQQSISNAKHFEELVNSHDQFMASVMKSSLLAPNCRALMVVIEKTIHIVHKFRQQIRHSLADPSKWETRMRKSAFAVAQGAAQGDLDATFGFRLHALPSPVTDTSTSHLNESVFEQSNYQPEHLDNLIAAAKTDFEKCMKFLMAVLLKLLSRGYEPHMAALVASLNWNKFYFVGTEAVISETTN